MEGFSTGVRGMTTLHTDDVRKVPDRMLNMAGNLRSEGRLENDIYSFIDVAVLIRRKLMTRPDGSSGLMRYVDQIGFFYRKDRDNRCILMLDGGEKTGEKFPDVIQKKFDEAHIGDPYVYEEKEPAVVRQSASYQKTEVPQSTGMVAEGRGSYGNRPEDMDRAFQEKMMKGMTFIGKKRKQG